MKIVWVMNKPKKPFRIVGEAFLGLKGNEIRQLHLLNDGEFWHGELIHAGRDGRLLVLRRSVVLR